jgi:hypothetical protein
MFLSQRLFPPDLTTWRLWLRMIQRNCSAKRRSFLYDLFFILASSSVHPGFILRSSSLHVPLSSLIFPDPGWSSESTVHLSRSCAVAEPELSRSTSGAEAERYQSTSEVAVAKYSQQEVTEKNEDGRHNNGNCPISVCR